MYPIYPCMHITTYVWALWMGIVSLDNGYRFHSDASVDDFDVWFLYRFYFEHIHHYHRHDGMMVVMAIEHAMHCSPYLCQCLLKYWNRHLFMEGKFKRKAKPHNKTVKSNKSAHWHSVHMCRADTWKHDDEELFEIKKLTGNTMN